MKQAPGAEELVRLADAGEAAYVDLHVSLRPGRTRANGDLTKLWKALQALLGREHVLVPGEPITPLTDYEFTPVFSGVDGQPDERLQFRRVLPAERAQRLHQQEAVREAFGERGRALFAQDLRPDASPTAHDPAFVDARRANLDALSLALGQPLGQDRETVKVGLCRQLDAQQEGKRLTYSERTMVSKAVDLTVNRIASMPPTLTDVSDTLSLLAGGDTAARPLQFTRLQQLFATLLESKSVNRATPPTDMTNRSDPGGMHASL